MDSARKVLSTTRVPRQKFLKIYGLTVNYPSEPPALSSTVWSRLSCFPRITARGQPDHVHLCGEGMQKWLRGEGPRTTRLSRSLAGIANGSCGASSARSHGTIRGAALGRLETAGCRRANGRSRRVSLIPVHPGEGRVIERTAAIRPRQRELVFMPHTCRSRHPPGSAQLGGEGVVHFGPIDGSQLAAVCRSTPV